MTDETMHDPVTTMKPVVLWDVDGVLNPSVPTAEHTAHRYEGLGPTGQSVSGTVYLNPAHGRWMAEVTAAGAVHAWAGSWGVVATSWIAPRLHPPAMHWPVIDVGVIGGAAFGWTHKFDRVLRFLHDQQPIFWLDDVFGGKDIMWAKDRTSAGVPSVFRHVMSPAGLARADIDAALAWLADIHRHDAPDRTSGDQ